MHATLPLLETTDFPALRRARPETLQVNLGYLCNQQCLHCHVAAGPLRKELMDHDNIEHVLNYLRDSKVTVLDLTGGAPEMNPHFKELVQAACELGVRVIDRCNLTILEEPGYEDYADFLADHQVEITASLPCYLEDNVDSQRGNGVFQTSIRVLQQLNRLGYGKAGTGLMLNLVYNPLDASLPPPQGALEQEYKQQLLERYDIVFNRLFVLANMPIQRFGSTLISKGKFHDYMNLLQGAHQNTNLATVMCRSSISVDWQGYVYDCDFNQMLNLPLHVVHSRLANKPRLHLSDLLGIDLQGQPIVVKNHCYGCTAGQGSSCGGALN